MTLAVRLHALDRANLIAAITRAALFEQAQELGHLLLGLVNLRLDPALAVAGEVCVTNVMSLLLTTSCHVILL